MVGPAMLSTRKCTGSPAAVDPGATTNLTATALGVGGHEPMSIGAEAVAGETTDSSPDTMRAPIARYLCISRRTSISLTSVERHVAQPRGLEYSHILTHLDAHVFCFRFDKRRKIRWSTTHATVGQFV